MVNRKREHSLKDIFDGLLYVLVEGCKWRSLPNDFAPWQTVYHYFREWRSNGLLEYLRNGMEVHGLSTMIKIKIAICLM